MVHCDHLAPFWRHGATKMVGSRPWHFGVTWCHQSHDHSTHGGPLPMSGPLWPNAYLAPLWRYKASNIGRMDDRCTDAKLILYSVQYKKLTQCKILTHWQKVTFHNHLSVLKHHHKHRLRPTEKSQRLGFYSEKTCFSHWWGLYRLKSAKNRI